MAGAPGDAGYDAYQYAMGQQAANAPTKPQVAANNKAWLAEQAEVEKVRQNKIKPLRGASRRSRKQRKSRKASRKGKSSKRRR
jgi:hypothetical protein